jgi:hypothetical protein
MRTFPHPNMENFVCPVCMTSADFPVVLVPIPGTEDGNIVQARQVHADCYRLTCNMNGYECDIEEG